MNTNAHKTIGPITIARCVLLALASSLLIGVANAQNFTTIKSFGILSNVTGFNPLGTLVKGPDGALYGTTSGDEGNALGTVFKVQPDGSGFTVLKWFTNSDVEGAKPLAGLTLSDGALYGTTYWGGTFHGGTVFRMNTDGSGYTVLKNFGGDVNEGLNSRSRLTCSGGVLYGTTEGGGSLNKGIVFKMNTNGTGFTVIKSFTGDDGARPVAGLTLSGDTLYGTLQGESSDYGTVFKVNTDGSGYTVLKKFTFSDGLAYPYAGLTLSGSVLFGTTTGGGSGGAGTVFKLNTDGTGYTVLKTFGGLNSGAYPSADLTLSGSVLYGTTGGGGSSGYGTVFKMNTDGSGFAVLKTFTGSDGRAPSSGLMLSDGVFYGTTAEGGTWGRGTVFKMNTDGTGHTVLKHFALSDGSHPTAGVTGSDGVLYGTTDDGGSSGFGTVFKLNTNGTGYAVLKNYLLPQSDGLFPYAGLTLSGSVLYGTTQYGGSSDWGTVFKINTDGSGYAVLKSFPALAPTQTTQTNSDGAYPFATLTVSGSALYGTTLYGGSSGAGTVFKVNTDGSDFTVLMNFPDDHIAAYPYYGRLTVSGNVLYGTTALGGSTDNGTVFKLNTDGTDYTVLKNFTFDDGGYPHGGLMLSGSVLYGTTESGGGSSGNGTVFKLNTDGTDYTVLKNFTGDDGANPFGDLTLSGSVLYGTTYGGGSSGNGTVFKLNTDGTGFRVLKGFAGFPSEGANPSEGLTLSGGALYGTTLRGGTLDLGTVFKLESPITLIIERDGSAGLFIRISSLPDVTYRLQRAASATGPWSDLATNTAPASGLIEYHETTPPPGQAFYRTVQP